LTPDAAAPPIGRGIWGDTRIELPPQLPRGPYRDAVTGATIDTGLFNGQRARELSCGTGASCPTTTPGQLTLLGDLLGDSRPTPVREGHHTLYKSIGHAAEDVAAFRHVYENALRAGSGRPINL